MAKKTGWVKLSGYLFILGIIIAVIDGLVTGVIPYVGEILVIIGTIMGLLAAFGMGSIERRDTELFMLAVIALIAAGGAGTALATIPTVGSYLQAMIHNIAALVAPAAVIVALEAIWAAGSTKF